MYCWVCQKHLTTLTRSPWSFVQMACWTTPNSPWPMTFCIEIESSAIRCLSAGLPRFSIPAGTGWPTPVSFFPHICTMATKHPHYQTVLHTDNNVHRKISALWHKWIAFAIMLNHRSNVCSQLIQKLGWVHNSLNWQTISQLSIYEYLRISGKQRAS